MTITFPALIVLIMVIFQVGLWWHARHLALAAAEEGARAARAYESTAAAGQARATDYLGKLGPRILTSREVTASRTDTTATVHVRGTVMMIVPVLRLTVDEQSTGPIERYVPPPP